MSQAMVQTKNKIPISSKENFASDHWDIVITSKKSWIDLKLKELWQYRDLLLLLVWRDYTHVYKQTILGPLWYIIQPVMITLVFTVVFGNIAGISTDGIPQTLFYLSGITCWYYFADCLNKTSTTFKDNQQIFGKVYFTRLIVPLSIVISNLIKFGIQFFLFLGFLLYFYYTNPAVQPNRYLLLFPFLILLIGGLGLGFGLFITAFTVKYRDLVFLLQFGIQLAMYATPIVYPLSTVDDKYRWIIELNPMTAIVETFRYGFTGAGEFSWMAIGYSTAFMCILLVAGMIVFNRTERNFMDTV